MNRKHAILTHAALAVLAIPLAAAPVPKLKPPKTPAEMMVGTWTQVNPPNGWRVQAKFAGDGTLTMDHEATNAPSTYQAHLRYELSGPDADHPAGVIVSRTTTLYVQKRRRWHVAELSADVLEYADASGTTSRFERVKTK